MRQIVRAETPQSPNEACVDHGDSRFGLVVGGELLAIVKAASASEDWAWTELMRRYSGMIRVICRSFRLSGADTAEVSQITWLKLFENIDRIREPTRIGSWLATTARRECLRVLRTNNREVCEHADSMAKVPDARMRPLDADTLDAERDRAVRLAYSRLPPRCQRLLGLLTGDEAMSYKALSELLDMPIGSIGPTRGRCLEHLERLMAELGVMSS
jgi:RNA polymerase sigma factor (sigma-70 family)